MASAGGRVWTPPVEPETTDTPSTVNSLLSVRLPLMDSWLALMPVASPPEDTPAVSDSKLRICDWATAGPAPGRVDHVAQRGAIGGKRTRGLAGHRNGFGDGAGLQREVDAHALVYVEGDAGDIRALEAAPAPRLCNGRWAVRRAIHAGVVGCAAPLCHAGVGIDDGDRGVGTTACEVSVTVPEITPGKD